MVPQTNPVLFLISKLWLYSKGNRGQVVLYVTLFLGANTVGFVEPFIVAHVLNTIQTQGVTSANIFYIVAVSSLLIVTTLAFWAFHGPARVIETRNAFIARANFKKYLVEGVLDLPSAWHTDHHSGDTIDKISKATEGLYRFSSDTFEGIGSFLKLLTSFGVLVYFDTYAALIIVPLVIITLQVILRFDKILVKQDDEINKIENHLSAKFFDVISNISTVIILRVERLVADSIAKKTMQSFTLSVKNSKVNETKWFIVSVCGALTTFFVLVSYLYGHLYTGTAIAIGTIYLLYSYVQRVTDTFFHFAYKYGDFLQQKTRVQNADDLIKEFQTKKVIQPLRLGSTWKNIQISSLFFSYHTDEGAEQHLNNISLSIKPGERIAFIGESGSGKTTLLKLLRGLYQPERVELTLDGKLIKQGLAALSPHITLIPQDPEIFATTIRENITLGIDHSSSFIKRFTDMARFTDVVERLPHKLDSSIVEKGVNLSGGEKQRLALARGLMACEDKTIILLDEPTSSVDLKNETMIYKTIFQAFKKKTIISSIHRLHLLPLFDTIYFFSKGQIIASGTFEGLLASSNTFKQIWEKYQKTQERAQ